MHPQHRDERAVVEAAAGHPVLEDEPLPHVLDRRFVALQQKDLQEPGMLGSGPLKGKA